MRPMTRLGLACAVATAVSACVGPAADPQRADASTGQESQAAGRVTFMQWTDPHLFDAGIGRHAEGVLEEALDNRAAFHWAVLETNRLQLTEPRRIDFVVITGDFGLSNVDVEHNPAVTLKPCECPLQSRTEEGPIDPVKLVEAAAEVAGELSALLVKHVYLIPGETDLCHEDPRDLHRWAQFVQAVRTNLTARHSARAATLTRIVGGSKPAVAPDLPEVVDLTYSLETPPSSPARENGFALIGLNTAYFRPHDDPAVQTAANRAISAEIELLKQRIHSGASYLLFTHIPDVEEPRYPDGDMPRDRKLAADSLSSWRLIDVPSSPRKTWASVLDGRGLAGVFAGHIHTSVRETYPQNFTWAEKRVDPLVARKTWVAPPLAEAHQWTPMGQKTARGMLLVTVTNNGAMRLSADGDPSVDVRPIWFTTQEQKVATVGDDKLAQARAAELDGSLDAAAAAFVDALQSQDPATRATATQGLARTREAMRLWWWRIGKYFLPLRWWHFYPRDTAAGAFMVLLFVALVSALRRYGRSVVLLKPDELTDGAPAAWLSQELMYAQAEIVWRLRREAKSHQAGGQFLGTFVLTAPSSALDVAALPQVQGFDIKGIAAFVLAIWRYFGWTVQPGVAVSGTNLSVFAVRRWAWLPMGAWRETRILAAAPAPGPAPPAPGAAPPPPAAAGDISSELPVAARRLAARIIGARFVTDRRHP
jgi:hypothetical protein